MRQCQTKDTSYSYRITKRQYFFKIERWTEKQTDREKDKYIETVTDRVKATRRERERESETNLGGKKRRRRKEKKKGNRVHAEKERLRQT